MSIQPPKNKITSSCKVVYMYLLTLLKLAGWSSCPRSWSSLGCSDLESFPGTRYIKSDIAIVFVVTWLFSPRVSTQSRGLLDLPRPHNQSTRRLPPVHICALVKIGKFCQHFQNGKLYFISFLQIISTLIWSSFRFCPSRNHSWGLSKIKEKRINLSP